MSSKYDLPDVVAISLKVAVVIRFRAAHFSENSLNSLLLLPNMPVLPLDLPGSFATTIKRVCVIKYTSWTCFAL